MRKKLPLILVLSSLCLLGRSSSAWAVDWDPDNHRFDWSESLDASYDTGSVNNSIRIPPVRSSHYTEIRDAIDYAASASACNVPDAWNNVSSEVRESIGSPGTSISSAQINALRTAVRALYAAKSQPVPASIQNDASAGDLIRRTHIQDLRDALDNLLADYCSTLPAQNPTCTGDRYWDGSQCVCFSGQTWNGTQCVANACTETPYPWEGPIGGIYTSNWDTDCSNALAGREVGGDWLARMWAQPSCVGNAYPPVGQWCVSARNIYDARAVGCGGPKCIFCSTRVRETFCGPPNFGPAKPQPPKQQQY